MPPDLPLYEEALLRLATIERLKQQMHRAASALCRTASASIFLPTHDVEHALAIIAEALDDLFFEPKHEARNQCDRYENHDRNSALREWDNRSL